MGIRVRRFLKYEDTMKCASVFRASLLMRTLFLVSILPGCTKDHPDKLSITSSASVTTEASTATDPLPTSTLTDWQIAIFRKGKNVFVVSNDKDVRHYIS